MPGPNPQFNSSTEVHDKLIAGDKKLVTAVLILISGENVVRGEVLGQITASLKVNSSLNAAVDGSEVARFIAAEDMDATAGDKEIMVYREGEFDDSEVTFGTGQTIANTTEDLANVSIHLKSTISA